MNEYLKLKKANCKNCYKCIRHCPVKSIRFTDGQAQIVEDECILCGHCFVACPQNAKEIRNDVDRAKALLAGPAPVYASVAPSFVANYPGVTIAAMERALVRLGFAGAEETALGATMVKKRYDEMVDEGNQDVIISSCCHTVNLLIQKHYPEALPYLAKVLSPMQAHCKTLKQQHPGARTVFIGPCISKKAEADQYAGIVDCALTFEELTQWLQEEEVAFEVMPEDDKIGKARLFPTTGGILRSMDCARQDYSYLTVDGIENCIQAMEDITNGSLHHCFIEMSACAGSCIGGPAMEHKGLVQDTIAVQHYAGKEDFSVEPQQPAEIQKEIGYLGLHRQMPGSQAIEEILHKMGKMHPDQELNCGSCGYNTCREKAVAVYQGKADLTMCLPFLKEKAESFSDTVISNTPNAIIVLNEALEIQQLNAAACGLMNIQDQQDVLGDQVVRILDPGPFLEVLETGRSVRDQTVRLDEYNKYVEQTIIYDRSYHILMSIMRDITEEEAERARKERVSKETIEITDNVINKQMRIVQEIASLLGETTAETKIALTQLKETLKND